jgi:hypothetical protein
MHIIKHLNLLDHGRLQDGVESILVSNLLGCLGFSLKWHAKVWGLVT